MSRDISIKIDADDAACLAPILRGRIEELEHVWRTRSQQLTDFDLRADRRYTNRIRNCLNAIEEAVGVRR